MIQTRRATIKDGHKIAQLLSEWYNFANGTEAYHIFLREYSLHYHFRVAVLDKEIIGVINWRMHGLIKHGIVKLKRVAFFPETTNWREIYESLFDSALAEADHFYKQKGSHLRKVYMVTPEGSTKMHDFLQDKGMTKEAVLRDHYYEGRDEFLYSLFLPSSSVGGKQLLAA